MATEHKGIQLPLLHDQAFDFAEARQTLLAQAEARDGQQRLIFSQAVTAAVATAYWLRVSEAAGVWMPIRLAPVASIELRSRLLDEYAAACARLEHTSAFFEIGELYTQLLPTEFRSKNGVYYTPPHLVRRLLDLMEAQGADWRTARVLDPACGGAAFATFVANRMLAANTHLPAEARLRDISDRLVGIDSDPFAAWLSAVLVDVVCLPVMKEADRRIDTIIREADALDQSPEELGSFDVVVGNPPYSKVKLNGKQRQRFAHSLFGHANLYGVFTHLAVMLARPGALIGFVTPTSFLGGEYFKNLRSLLITEAPPVHATFVSDRNGVFSDVLQETMLAIFRRTPGRNVCAKKAQIRVELLSSAGEPAGSAQDLGSVAFEGVDGRPWILPRMTTQRRIATRLGHLHARLADYGYRVATGQLVWNRHKPQFRDQPGDGCYPVLWAECVRSDGSFVFQAEGRNHRPFIKLRAGQEHLLNQEPCVLVQRTTSKEQARRLVAGVIPNSFVVEQCGFVVENHVNMVLPTRVLPALPLRAFAELLNTSVVDEAFRCISGSVAVSAYELENLPLPDPVSLGKELRKARAVPGSLRFREIVEAAYLNGR